MENVLQVDGHGAVVGVGLHDVSHVVPPLAVDGSGGSGQDSEFATVLAAHISDGVDQNLSDFGHTSLVDEHLGTGSVGVQSNNGNALLTSCGDGSLQSSCVVSSDSDTVDALSNQLVDDGDLPSKKTNR